MKLIRFIFLIFLSQSCSFGERDLVFGEGIEYFDDDFVSHFPIKVPLSFSLTTVSPNTRNSHPHVWLKIYLTKSRVRVLIDSLNKVAIAKYETNDSCLLVIDKHLTKFNWYKK